MKIIEMPQGLTMGRSLDSHICKFFQLIGAILDIRNPENLAPSCMDLKII